MEPLDSSFHPKGIILIPWLMVVVALIAGSSWLATPPSAPRMLSNTTFYFGVSSLLATTFLFLFQLHLHTTRDAFVVSVRFLSATVYRRETPGISWRPVATPGNQPETESGFCRYRVEALREDGSRQIALGPLMCFAFGVDSL